MSRMGALEYAKKYWELEVPIFNDDNEILRYEKVKFGKYRLYQGWNPANVGGSKPPPGQTELVSAISTYAHRLFKQKKELAMRVKNIWGSQVLMGFKTWDELRPLLPRATQAFSGKGTPEDVQLTLQLAARCGIVAPGGLQQYCDERVDHAYPRLGLDCNGFVGNYLRYRNSETQWMYIDPVSSSKIINGDMGINGIVTRLHSQPVTNEEDMFTPRMHVLAMVDNAGKVIDGGFGPIGHIMILEAINSVKKQAVFPPIPKQYLSGKYLWYSGVEATPAVGLSRIAYAILNVAKNGIATIWRSEVNSLIKVKMYPVN